MDASSLDVISTSWFAELVKVPRKRSGSEHHLWGNAGCCRLRSVAQPHVDLEAFEFFFRLLLPYIRRHGLHSKVEASRMGDTSR